MAALAESQVTNILNEINATITASRTELAESRAKLLSLSRRLTAALESPSEFIQRIGYAEVSSSTPVPNWR